MIPTPFRGLGRELVGAIQEGAAVAATIFSRHGTDADVPAAKILASQKNGLTVEFVLAALYHRHSAELSKYVDETAKLEAMFREFSSSQKGHKSEIGGLAEEPPSPVGSDSALGWTVEFSPELLRIISNAARIAAQTEHLASIQDLVKGLEQDSLTVSRLNTEWGISFRSG
jgi:hypothetical protein